LISRDRFDVGGGEGIPHARETRKRTGKGGLPQEKGQQGLADYRGKEKRKKLEFHRIRGRERQGRKGEGPSTKKRGEEITSNTEGEKLEKKGQQGGNRGRGGRKEVRRDTQRARGEGSDEAKAGKQYVWGEKECGWTMGRTMRSGHKLKGPVPEGS